MGIDCSACKKKNRGAVLIRYRKTGSQTADILAKDNNSTREHSTILETLETAHLRCLDAIQFGRAREKPSGQ